jgi:hypothetical protein
MYRGPYPGLQAQTSRLLRVDPSWLVGQCVLFPFCIPPPALILPGRLTPPKLDNPSLARQHALVRVEDSTPTRRSISSALPFCSSSSFSSPHHRPQSSSLLPVVSLIPSRSLSFLFYCLANTVPIILFGVPIHSFGSKTLPDSRSLRAFSGSSSALN